MAKDRAIVSREDTWDVEAIFATPEEWESAYTALKGEGEGGWQTLSTLREKLSEHAALKSLLDAYFDISLKFDQLLTYSHLKNDEDLGNQEGKERHDRGMILLHTFASQTSWIEPEILQLPKEHLSEAAKAYPIYRVFFERLLELKPHTLSVKEEGLLSLSAKSLSTPGATFNLMNNVDMTFDPVNGEELTVSRYSLYMRSEDRAKRQGAYENFMGAYGAFENTLAELLSGHVQTHLFQSRARHYPDCVTAALTPNQVDPAVFHALIKATHKELPHLHNYISERKRILELDQLYLYDMYVPLVPDVKLNFSFDEAVEDILESVAPLGSDYQTILKKGLTDERWVDRFENKGKRSGAYSSGCFGTHPYILMNYNGLLDDMMTLTHEAGHSMHTYHSHKHQPYPTSHYTIFVAEVASTFHEELLFRHLLAKRSDPLERAFLINQKIDGLRATFFRQVLFAEFEYKIHQMAEQGIPLNAAILKKTYGDLNREYYGKDLEVDDHLSREFMRVPHFYSNFYVYQYATGISAALSLVDRVLSGGDSERKDYLNFLSAGSSKPPVDLLKDAGVDMTQEAPVRRLITYFNDLVGDFR